MSNAPNDMVFPEIVFTDDVAAASNAPAIVADANESPRIVSDPAYSGGKLHIGGYDQPVILDVATLSTDPVPFVLYHDINKPLGMAAVVACDGKKMTASGPITHAEKDYAVDEIKAAKRGFVHRASVHTYPPERENVTLIRQGETFFANSRNQTGPFYYVRNARLKNISLVTTPGDPHANAQIIAQNQTGESSMSTLPATNTGTADNQQQTADQVGQKTETPVTPPQTAAVPSTAQTTPTTTTPVVKAQDGPDPMIANQNRIEAIRSGDLLPEIAAQAISDGWSFETAKEKNSVMTGSIAVNRGGPPNVDKLKNDLPSELEMIVASACQTAGLSDADLKTIGIREQAINELGTNADWRGAWLHDVMAHCVDVQGASEQRDHRRGRPTARYTGESLCYAAIEAQSRLDAKYGTRDTNFSEIRADADTGFSTHGLKQIWTLITRAMVLKAYDSVPSTWRHICKKVVTKDFREHTMHRTMLTGDYARNSDVGNEPPHATYAEQMFKLASDQWDLMVAISWKDLVNDEPGIFADRANELGRLAHLKQEKVVYTAILLAGDNLFKKDRTATPNTKHFSQNLAERAATDEWLKSISAAKKLMATARNPMDGELLNVVPEILLVPQVMEEEAKMFLTETRIGGNPYGPVNPHTNLKLVSAPLLNAENGLVTSKGEGSKKVPGSDSDFYLFSNPYAGTPVLGIAFYQGQEAPRIQTAQTRFSTDGIQTKSTICFDVGTMDYRGAVKSKVKS